MQPRVREACRPIVDALVQGRYDDVERMTHGVRATAEEPRIRMEEFGGPAALADAPESEWAALEVVEIGGAEPRAWFVDVDLWTADGERSDLTLSLDIVEDGDELRVTVNDLRMQ
ncbi:MAG TPA: hypothetical protein VF156_01150 [Agromyces sp.]